jgi:chemotaxis protein CheX
MSIPSIPLQSFVDPIVLNVCSVIETMGQIKLKPQMPEISPCATKLSLHGDVSGIISVQDAKMSGTMAVIFEKNLILKIYSNILGGEPVAAIDHDVRDAVMEMTNVIFGNAKRDINKLGFDIQAARPSVVEGPGHKIHHDPRGNCLSLTFESEAGRLFIEFSALTSSPSK